jgi:hypothetical protein
VTRSRAYTPACLGQVHRPAPDDIDAGGRAACPVCGRRIKVLLPSRWNGRRAGQLARHGFIEDRWSPTEELTVDDLMAMLRMAQLEFEQVNPRWLKAVENRAFAAWRAGRVGVTDSEIAVAYKIPVSNVVRMRARVRSRVAAARADDEPEVNLRAEV